MRRGGSVSGREMEIPSDEQRGPGLHLGTPAPPSWDPGASTLRGAATAAHPAPEGMCGRRGRG
jgi:hypothetical protein